MGYRSTRGRTGKTAKSKSVVIHQSNIYDNSAVLGGGIGVETQHLHIVRSTFTYNDAQSGGAVYVTNAKDIQSQDIVFQSFNSTYSHNGAYEKGGAIFANNANIDFYHNTILENYFRSWNLAHIWSQTGGGNYEDLAWQLQEQPTLKGRAIYISDINPGYVDIQHPMYISLFGNVIFGLSGVSADLLYYDVMQSIYWVQWFPAHYNNLMSNSIGGPALLTSAVGNVNVANGTNLNLVEDATLGLTAVHRVHPSLLGQPGYTSIIDQLHPCISRK
ncbi:MAG: hypothetical protein R3A45_12920 [Bdellovibrionota bacterium]